MGLLLYVAATTVAATLNLAATDGADSFVGSILAKPVPQAEAGSAVNMFSVIEAYRQAAMRKALKDMMTPLGKVEPDISLTGQVSIDSVDATPPVEPEKKVDAIGGKLFDGESVFTHHNDEPYNLDAINRADGVMDKIEAIASKIALRAEAEEARKREARRQRREDDEAVALLLLLGD